MAALDVLAEVECGSGSCAEAGERGRFLLQTLRLRDGNVQGITEEYAPEVTRLNSSDFSGGTLRLRNSGHYELTEDVEFEPHAPGMSWSHIPPDSTSYPQKAGYFLGFFAAITIEADGVTLDCNGHEIKMSSRFHKLQRFFSIIELGSSPFPLGQGPPQFASDLTTSEPPVFARNVVIKNCKLGLSAHHSIHGNDNTGVTVENVQMYDFEVAGVALNGGSDVELEGLNIGPSLQGTFRAGLSAAIFLDHLGTTLMETHRATRRAKQGTNVHFRGKQTRVVNVLSRLQAQGKLFLEGAESGLDRAVGDGSELPDGSAIYGILLHRSGLAINRLGFCGDDTDIADKRVSNIRLKNIVIEGLSVKVDQVVKTVIDGKPVTGPSGDVFQVTAAWDPTDCYRYKGNVITDAQLALGKVCKNLASVLSDAEMKFYCGGANVPDIIHEWAAGTWTCEQTKDWAKSLIDGTSSASLTCEGDAMAHFNKGAIGMRLGFQENIWATGVTIKDVANEGTANASPWCNVTGEPYQGLDVRGVSLAHMKDLNRIDVTQNGFFRSTDPKRVFPITGFLQMRTDDVKA